nr:patatin-like phospholipase family protein [Ktedonobacterales bacterium]
MIEQAAAKQPPQVAFVLSGGAALGAAQVGMLRALLERGITPDLVVGTSIGSWNGLWIAAHPNLEWLDKLEQVWRSITLFELFG